MWGRERGGGTRAAGIFGGSYFGMEGWAEGPDGDCKRNVRLETCITDTESEEGFDCMCAK